MRIKLLDYSSVQSVVITFCLTNLLLFDVTSLVLSLEALQITFYSLKEMCAHRYRYFASFVLSWDRQGDMCFEEGSVPVVTLLLFFASFRQCYLH